MEKLVIGTVRVEYNTQGTIESAVFNPQIKINLLEDKGDLGRQMLSIKGNTQEVFKKNADLVLGAWFAKMNEIELADRDRYEVASAIVECEKYLDGSVKTCALEYIFQERSALLN